MYSKKWVKYIFVSLPIMVASPLTVLSSCGENSINTYIGYTDLYDGSDGDTNSYATANISYIGNKQEYWVGGSRTWLKKNDKNITNYTLNVTSSDSNVIKVLQINDDVQNNKFHLLFLDIGIAKISANFMINNRIVYSIAKTWTLGASDFNDTEFSYGPNLFTVEKSGTQWNSTSGYFEMGPGTAGHHPKTCDIFVDLKQTKFNDININDSNNYIDTPILPNSTSNFNFSVSTSGNPLGGWTSYFKSPTITTYTDKTSHYGVLHFERADSIPSQSYYIWIFNLSVTSNNGYTWTYESFKIYLQ